MFRTHTFRYFRRDRSLCGSRDVCPPPQVMIARAADHETESLGASDHTSEFGRASITSSVDLREQRGSVDLDGLCGRRRPSLDSSAREDLDSSVREDLRRGSSAAADPDHSIPTKAAALEDWGGARSPPQSSDWGGAEDWGGERSPTSPVVPFREEALREETSPVVPFREEALSEGRLLREEQPLPSAVSEQTALEVANPEQTLPPAVSEQTALEVVDPDAEDVFPPPTPPPEGELHPLPFGDELPPPVLPSSSHRDPVLPHTTISGAASSSEPRRISADSLGMSSPKSFPSPSSDRAMSSAVSAVAESAASGPPASEWGADTFASFDPADNADVSFEMEEIDLEDNDPVVPFPAVVEDAEAAAAGEVSPRPAKLREQKPKLAI